MRYIDVFNGDADGLCALHQLRLAEPVDSQLITGLKREIDLLAQVQADPQCLVTVLDLALDRNRPALLRLLSEGAAVRYFDHHIADDIPVHPRLQTWIDPSPETCTSILVDQQLGGRFRLWAIVAAYGDGLPNTARRMAQAQKLDADQQAKLRAVGESLNYNAYGDTEADVVIHPRELYGIVHRYVDPFEFRAREPIVEALMACMKEDLEAAQRIPPTHEDAYCRVHRLPDAAWSRRVIGTLANWLADQDQRRACAVAKDAEDGTLRVSLRVPRAITPAPGDDADRLCKIFGGAGRARAAGINQLPIQKLDDFVCALRAAAQRWAASSNAIGR